MLIIGIAGGTGSGKTTVVRKIIESLPAGEVVLLPQDSYYKDSSHVPVEERQNINFDHPDAFEWSLLSKHVAMLREGKSIEQPTYSYLTCTREPETIHIEPREVVIIEGILALCDKKLRSMMDLKIFVHPLFEIIVVFPIRCGRGKVKTKKCAAERFHSAAHFISGQVR